jgi:hypothetical protein
MEEDDKTLPIKIVAKELKIVLSRCMTLLKIIIAMPCCNTAWEMENSYVTRVIPNILGNPKFITLFKNVRRIYLSWAISIQSKPPPIPFL